MVLYYGTMEFSIYERKEQCWLTNTMQPTIYNGKHFANMPKQLKFLNKYIAVKLWLIDWKKNYVTILKTIELWFTMGKKTLVL